MPALSVAPISLYPLSKRKNHTKNDIPGSKGGALSLEQRNREGPTSTPSSLLSSLHSSNSSSHRPPLPPHPRQKIVGRVKKNRQNRKRTGKMCMITTTHFACAHSRTASDPCVVYWGHQGGQPCSKVYRDVRSLDLCAGCWARYRGRFGG